MSLKLVDARITGKSNALFLGKSGGGKTVLFCKLFTHKLCQQFDVCFIFCPTIHYEGNNRKYASLYSQKHCKVIIFDDYSDKKVEEVYKKIPAGGGCKLFVFDDCITKGEYLKARHQQDHIINEICTSGRHKKVSAYFISQTTKALDTTIRDSLDMIFLLPNSAKQVITYCKDIVSMPTKQFANLYKEETNSLGGFLLISNGVVYTKRGRVD